MRYIGVALIAILFLSFSEGCRAIFEGGGHVHFPSSGRVKAKHRGHGPPPHAPAHGYRHKHHNDIELEFDSGLGVYFAINMPDVFFYDGLYLKISDGHWFVTDHLDSPWRTSLQDEVPLKLKKARGKGHKRKGKGKGWKKKNKWD